MEYLSKKELMNRAKTAGIRGRSKMVREDLISALKELRSQPAQPVAEPEVESPEEEEVDVEDAPAVVGFDHLSVKEMKALCKERGVKGYSGKKKGELIQILGQL